MKYYLIVGEASGDLHASNLMRALQHEDPQVEFRFFGGDLMKAVGGTCVKHYRELAYMGFIPVLLHLRTIFRNMEAYMGFIPVLLHLRTIFRNMDYCKKEVEAWQPDVLILVDYPGFNLKIARRGADDGLPAYPRRRHRHRADLQHVRAADAAGRRPGHPHVHPAVAGRRTDHGGRRRRADPQRLLCRRPRRRHPPVGRFRPRRPGQHRQPRRVLRAGAGRAHPGGGRLRLADRVRAAAAGRPHRAAARHHAGPRRARLGAGGVPAGRAQADHRLDPRRRDQLGGCAVKLSILMPVFNEAETVEVVVKRVLDVPYPCDVELVIVDDGSSDDTATLLAGIDDPRVSVHTHPVIRGTGAASRTAAAAAPGTPGVMGDAELIIRDLT